MKSMTETAVMLLRDTRAAARNARKPSSKAQGFNYFYTEPLGFVGGATLLRDISEVYVT